MAKDAEERRRTVDSALTARAKDCAFSALGADLVGVANIERFEHAPPMMSPQGIMPAARSVIVMAVHHPDACVELGGLKHPQEIGPYRVQYLMNSRLDEMSYRMALFLERQGFRAVPIVSSNIWRYKGYKDLTAQFAPDMSHLHAAVAAGLAEFGYSGLAITPEFGARQRYVSVITDAELEPTALIEPGTVCDMCRLCVKHCRSGALSTEIDGMNVVEIEGRRYEYANKNLWRCAWGEHFNLDLDLPLPERVDEEVILEAVRRHGFRGGEMGSCLRHCVPKGLRYFDRDYTDAPRRRRAVSAGGERDRGFEERLRSLACGHGVDFVIVTPAAELSPAGMDVKEFLPDGATAVSVGLHYRTLEGKDPAAKARKYLLDSAAYDVARELERRGHSAVCSTDFSEDALQKMIEGVLPGRAVETATVITSAELAPTPRRLPVPKPRRPAPEELTCDVRRLVQELGADLVGTAPAERLGALRPQLSGIFDGREFLVARDRAGIFREYEPEIRTETVRVLTPGDHLPGARSVVVVGLRLPKATVERTARPPAEAVGPYAFAQYESVNLLRIMAFRAMRLLEDRGFCAALTFDLCGTASFVANPRGEQPDAFSNRFAAVAAGLGRLGKGGFVLTPRFGPNVRFVAVVTDAELAPERVLGDANLVSRCERCSRCTEACRTKAFGREVAVDIDGMTERFRILDRDRCDWAKRYSLVGEEGVNYLGWDMNVPPPDEIDESVLAAGLRRHPPIPKYRPCNFEACVFACPLARAQ